MHGCLANRGKRGGYSLNRHLAPLQRRHMSPQRPTMTTERSGTLNRPHKASVLVPARRSFELCSASRLMSGRDCRMRCKQQGQENYSTGITALPSGPRTFVRARRNPP
jgi:hypothetical protein